MLLRGIARPLSALARRQLPRVTSQINRFVPFCQQIDYIKAFPFSTDAEPTTPDSQVLVVFESRFTEDRNSFRCL